MAAPLALGLLVTPRHLRHDARVRTIEGEYGTLFGATGFSSSVYSMHDPERGGSCCSQACVIMATGLLADRGAQIPGSYEATCRAKRLAEDGAIPIDGLNFEETLSLLREPDLRTSASKFRLLTQKAGTVWLAERLLEAYVVARCPVLLFVEADTWYRRQVDDNPANHCVVIVGCRYSSPMEPYSPGPSDLPAEFCTELLSDVVVHDPGFRPFGLWPLKHAIFSSSRYRPDGRNANGCLNLIFTAAGKVKTHAYDCYLALAGSHDLPLAEESDSTWLSRYRPRDAAGVARDLRISLVHRDDVLARFFTAPGCLHPGSAQEGTVRARWELLRNRIAHEFPRYLEPGWYWAFAGYEAGRLRTLWLCNAQQSLANDQSWEWRFHVYDDGTHLGCAVPSHDGRIANPDPEYHHAALTRATEPPIPTQLHEFSPAARNGRKPSAPALGPVAESLSLRPSVISSSSTRSLSALLSELVAIDRLEDIDLYVLREQDIREMAGDAMLCGNDGNPLPIEDATRLPSATLMAQRLNVEPVARWYFDQLTRSENSPRVAAFATYYPQIANTNNVELRTAAINALTYTVQMGIRLQEQLADSRKTQVDDVIVEIVCGSRFDSQSGDPPSRVVEAEAREKLRLVFRGLRDVVCQVNQWCQNTYGGSPPCRWCIGAELEPGYTYALRNLNGVGIFAEVLRTEFQDLMPYVGLNVDIAHMLMSDVRASNLQMATEDRLYDLLVHAHIAGHPGMHTRDQRINGFIPVDRFEAEEYAFLVTLAEVWGKRRVSGSGLPASGCVAVELEGCSRIGWVHSSVHFLRQMCESVHNFGQIIQRRGSRRIG